MRELIIFLILAISTGFISCKNNPSSPEESEQQAEQFKISGKVLNNYIESPGPVWNVDVVLITGKDTLKAKTNDRGYFEFVKETPFDAENYDIQLQKVFYENAEYQFTVPENAFESGNYDAGTFKMEMSNKAIFVSGEIERSVDDDSVVVNLFTSKGCYNEDIGPESSDNQKQNIGSNSIFNIAISKTCQRIFLSIESQNHRKTKQYDIDISNKELEESPNRITGLNCRIYKDDEPISVTVVMKFYTMLNGEKHVAVLHPRERFNVTPPVGSSENFEPYKNGTLEIETKINEGQDTLSVVMWRNYLHSFPRKNFPLLDYKTDDNKIIDLGEHELQFEGIYIFGKLTDIYYDFKGEFQLSIDGESYDLDENKMFVFPANPNSSSYQLKLQTTYYEDIDTTFTKNMLNDEGDIYTGMNLNLTPTLYQLLIKVDLIDLDGSKLPPKVVPVELQDKQIKNTDNKGILQEEINVSKPINYSFTVNKGSNKLDNFTSESYKIDFKTHESYSLEKQAAIYKKGPLVDYTPTIRAGTIWKFDYKQGTYYGTADDLVYEGELTWEVTERLTDTTYTVHESFDGTRMIYSAGEKYYSDSDLADSKYLVTVSNKKIKFEPKDQQEENLRYIKFTEAFNYVLNMYQPSTYIDEYTHSEKIEDDFTTTTISTTYSENSGIKDFKYYLLDYDSETVDVSLKNFNP